MCGSSLLVAYIIGILLILGTWLKPRFFWVSSQCLNIRRHLGDQGAEMFYYGVGSLLIAINIAYFRNAITPLFAGALLAIFAYQFLAKNRW